MTQGALSGMPSKKATARKGHFVIYGFLTLTLSLRFGVSNKIVILGENIFLDEGFSQGNPSFKENINALRRSPSWAHSLKVTMC